MFSRIKDWGADFWEQTVEAFRVLWPPLMVLVGTLLVIILLATGLSQTPTRHKTNTCTWNADHTTMTCVEDWK